MFFCVFREECADNISFGSVCCDSVCDALRNIKSDFQHQSVTLYQPIQYTAHVFMLAKQFFQTVILFFRLEVTVEWYQLDPAACKHGIVRCVG